MAAAGRILCRLRHAGFKTSFTPCLLARNRAQQFLPSISRSINTTVKSEDSVAVKDLTNDPEYVADVKKFEDVSNFKEVRRAQCLLMEP